MPNTNQNHLKAATAVSDLPDSSPLLAFLRCLKDTLKCGRQHKTFLRWFSEKWKKGISFSYRFTGLESKYFCWQVATLIQELLKIPTLSKGHVLKLHTLSFVGVKLKDAVSIYSRVMVSIEQFENFVPTIFQCKQFVAYRHYSYGVDSRSSHPLDWAWIQCRVERQSTWNSLVRGKHMQCQKELTVVDCVQTWVCLHGMVERARSVRHCLSLWEEEHKWFLYS